MTVADFLGQNFSTAEQLLDLRFFEDDLLCHEIDQTGGHFLDINDGTVAVTHDSMVPRGPETWGYWLIAAVVATAVIISFKPEIPETGSRDQRSATNRLGDTSNEPRINERIDDIFGTVTKHMPPLWQVPYRVGVDDQETEVLFLCVGRGRYQITANDWFDGDTLMKDIPNASVSIYTPGTHPGDGSPSLQIGPSITEPIGIYRESKDLNPAELEPPNSQDTNEITWRGTGSGSTATLVAANIPDGFNLIGTYNVGDQITLNGCNYMAPTGAVYLALNAFGDGRETFDGYGPPVDLSENSTLQYTITAVTASSLTLTIPGTASPAVLAAWAAMSNYSFPVIVTKLSDPTELWSDVYVTDYRVPNVYFYRALDFDAGTYQIMNQQQVTYYISVGVAFDNRIGPITIPKGATQIILNFVSPNGFYKLVENNEQTVSVIIKLTIIELDPTTGLETGSSTDLLLNHSSNPSGVRKSVFRTHRITLPYSWQRIRAQRQTARDKSDNVSNVDIVEWRDLYSFQPVSVPSFGDVTTAHVVVPSNSQSRLIKQRKQNVNLTRLITQYLGNGNFGPAESFATDRFDQILIHVSLDPFIGRLELDDFNADGFLDLRDQITTYFGSDVFTKFGYDFDTTELTYQDTFMLIMNAVMCIPYVQSGVYDGFFERRQNTSSMQVTCRNKISGTETRKINYDRKYDGVELSYRDNSTGTSETIYIPLNRSATNPERVDYPGVTTAEQATKIAYRLYNKQLYQTDSVTFEMDDFGRNIVPGRRIDSPDSTRFTRREGVTDGYRVYDGEVVAVSGLVVRLSEPCYFTAGEDHYITFTKENGENSEPILCTQLSEYHVALETMPSEPIYYGYERDRTKYILVSEQLKQSVALLPRTIEFNMSDDGVETHTVSAVNYTNKYYQDDGAFDPDDEDYVEDDYVDNDYV